MMWLYFWLACTGELVTTDTHFVGTVSDPTGKPVANLVVTSMEAQARTASDGGFDLRVTPDNRILHFTARGTWYTLKTQPEHLGKVVPITVPETRAAAVECPAVDCKLALTWDLGDHLEALVNPGCRPGERVELEAIPKGAPAATCTVGRGPERRDVKLSVQDEGAVVRLARERQRVQVTVAPADGEDLPRDCRVQVGERVAPPIGRGVFATEAAGGVTVSAWCDDIPARPVRIDPAETPEVTLIWSAEAPTILLRLYAPWAEELAIAAEAPDAGWFLRLTPDEKGTVTLPTLAPGPYRLMVRGKDRDLPLATPPVVAPGPDVVMFGPEEDGTMVGTLAVVSSLPSGPLQVSVEP